MKKGQAGQPLQQKVGLLVYVCWLFVFKPLLKFGPVTGWCPWLLPNVEVRTNRTAQSTTVADQIDI